MNLVPLSETQTTPDILQWAAMKAMSDDTCKAGWQQYFKKDAMICFGNAAGTPSVCNGDSGGPIVCKENGKLVVTGK